MLELMDEDIRAALNEDSDVEDGEGFEALDDDFVTQAAVEPDDEPQVRMSSLLWVWKPLSPIYVDQHRNDE